MATLPMDPRRLRLLQQRIFAYDMPGGIPSVPPSLRPLCAGGWFFGQSLDERGLMVLDDLHQGTPRPVQPGRCVNFDGVDDYIEIGNQAAFQFGTQTSFSMGCWYNVSAGDADCGLIMKKDTGLGSYAGYCLRCYGTTGQVSFEVADGTNAAINLSAAAAAPGGQWVHAYGTYDGTTGSTRLYVNGALIKTVVNAALIGANTILNGKSLCLGALRSSGASYHLCTGKIFDARIYNRALTGSEVSAIYNTSKPGGRPEVAIYPENLVGHWKLDDGLRRNKWATIAWDSSGNGYHGGCFLTSESFRYSGADVPFSWQNECGYTAESQAAYAALTDVWTPKFDTWTAYGTDAKATALSAQSWAGRTGLYAAKFTDGALAGYAANRVSTYDVDLSVAGGRLYVAVADIALSRPLVGAEEIVMYWTGALSGPDIRLTASDNARLGDVTKFQTFTGATQAFPSSTSQLLAIYCGQAITGGDITVYVANVRYVDLMAHTDNGVLDGRYLGEYIPQNSVVPSRDVLGNVLQYTGPAPRNAKLIDSFCGTFDGADDSAAATDASDVTYFGNGGDDAPFSVSAWIRHTAGTFDCIMSRGSTSGDNLFEWGVLVDEYGRLTAGLYSTTDSNSLINRSVGYQCSQNVWHHVSVTYSGSKTNAGMKLYVDGVEVPTMAVNAGTYTGMTHNGDTIRIGNWVYGTGYCWTGQLVDARVYNSALSAADILSLYEGREITPQPVGHWPLQEGSGDTLYDVSGNGLHATLTGATLATFWGTRQSQVHRNIRRGFRLSGDVRIPSKLSGGAADGNATTNPAGVYHNNAETRIDFRGDTSASPWQEGLSPPADYDFGDAVSGLMRKGSITVEGVVRENNFYLLKE